MVIKDFMKLSSLVLQIPFYLLFLMYLIPTWTGEYDFYFLLFCAAMKTACPAVGRCKSGYLALLGLLKIH